MSRFLAVAVAAVLGLEVEGCATDGGAVLDFGLEPQDLTPDLNHLMPSGQAKMATIVWDQLPPSWK